MKKLLLVLAFALIAILAHQAHAAFFNPTSITTSTITAAGGVTADGNTTFTGTLFFNTANTVHYFPTPTQLVAGANCGGVTDTEVGKCFNDIYSADEGVVSTTVAQFPNAFYASSTFTTHIYCSSLGHKCQLIGGAGDGTVLKFGGAGSQSAVVLDYGPGPNASGTSMKQVQITAMEHIALIGTNNTLGSGQVGVKLGINNGAGHTVLNDVNITGFDKGAWLSTNTYGTSIQNSLFSANAQDIVVNSANNSGEDISLINDWIVDPYGTDATGGGSGCLDLEPNATENFTIIGGVIDNCQFKIGSGNLSVTLHGVNFENASHNTYGSYPWILQGSGGHLTIEGGQFMNDATSTAAGAPSAFVNASGTFDANGVTFTANGSATSTPNFVHMASTANVIVSGSYNVSDLGVASLVDGSAASSSFFSRKGTNPAFQIIAGTIYVGSTTIAADSTVSTLTGPLTVTATTTLQATLTQSGGTVGLASTTVTGSFTNTGNANITGSLAIGTTTSRGLIDLENTTSSGGAILDFYMGDTSSSLNNPIIISHKEATAGQTGSLTNIGFNAYINPATGNINAFNSSNGGYLTQVNTRNTATPTYAVTYTTAANVSNNAFTVNSSGTVLFGAATIPLCLEGYDSVNTSTKQYIYTASNVLTSTTTKPAFCQ